uniref:Uncharacterized protein n=1 Tax=Gallus gallus TaxID=9031 RepID=A0A8V0XRX8_CHICK
MVPHKAGLGHSRVRDAHLPEPSSRMAGGLNAPQPRQALGQSCSALPPASNELSALPCFLVQLNQGIPEAGCKRTGAGKLN